MLDKIRVYEEFSYDYIIDNNCIFSGRYYKIRRINRLRYGIELDKIRDEKE
jgi:hypothetical protein